MIPKIKVWDKVTKRVAEVDVIYFEMKSLWIRFKISDKLNHLDSRNFDEVEFMYGSGLPDCGNNEIFSGQVCHDEYSDVRGYVEFKEGCFYFTNVDESEMLESCNHDLTIVGVIWND